MPENENFKSLSYLKSSVKDKKKLELIKQFFKDFKNSKPLCGRNKPNHQHDPKFLWHYHIGYPNYNQSCFIYKQNKKCNPLNNGSNFCSMCINFSEQLDGLTSKAILHYLICENGEIIFWAWGDEHEPFPNKNLPIFKKIREWIKDPNNLI